MSKFGKCDDGEIHLINVLCDDFTVCGIASKDSVEEENGWKDCDEKTVTCPACIALIKSCRHIKTKENQ